MLTSSVRIQVENYFSFYHDFMWFYMSEILIFFSCKEKKMSVFSSLKIIGPTHFKSILFKPGRLSGLQYGIKMLYFQIKRKISISSEKVSIQQ